MNLIDLNLNNLLIELIKSFWSNEYLRNQLKLCELLNFLKTLRKMIGINFNMA